MKKATVIDVKGNEYEVEYKWIEETNTTIKFFADKNTYTGFSKFNIISWFLYEEELQEGTE